MDDVVVIDDGGQRSAWFGSFNYNVTSRYLNQEVLARSTELETRIKAEIGVDDGREMPKFGNIDWQIDRMDL